MQTRRLLALLLRDALITALTACLWFYTLHAQQSAAALHLVTAVFTVLCGYLVHEWGHLLGSLFSGAVVHLPPTPVSTFLFRFDTGRNSREQFIAMSLGGFIASIIAVAGLLIFLPLALLASRVALGLVLIGVIATFILEVPSVWRGAAMPSGAAFVSANQSAP